jgi:hypothetical protein
VRIIISIIISLFTVLVANANSNPDLSSISGKITDAKTNSNPIIITNNNYLKGMIVLKTIIPFFNKIKNAK